MVVEAAPVVPPDEDGRRRPVGTVHDGVHDARHERLARTHRRWRVFTHVTRWDDPGHRRQRTAGGVFQKACILVLDPEVQLGLPGQAGLGEVREPVVMAKAVELISHPQGANVAGIPATGDAMRVEVTDKRGLVVQRRQVVGVAIAAASRAATQGVQAVWPGRPRR